MGVEQVDSIVADGLVGFLETYLKKNFIEAEVQRCVVDLVRKSLLELLRNDH